MKAIKVIFTIVIVWSMVGLTAKALMYPEDWSVGDQALGLAVCIFGSILLGAIWVKGRNEEGN